MSVQKECPACKQSYITKDKRQKYCNKNCYYSTLSGKGNPFAGKKHKKESLDKMKIKLSKRMSGKKNPFYGKTHSKEIKDKLSKTHKENYKKNRKTLALNRMKRHNLSFQDLKDLWKEYKSTPVNGSFFTEKTGKDYRTIHKLLLDCNIVSKEELRKTCEAKKLFQSSGISAPEIKLLKILNKEFGKENVEHQKRFKGYYYDFCLFDKILIEYDGYYFHKVIKNPNDQIKTRIAQSHNMILYRVEEKKNRTTNWDKALQEIKTIVNEIQT